MLVPNAEWRKVAEQRVDDSSDDFRTWDAVFDYTPLESCLNKWPHFGHFGAIEPSWCSLSDERFFKFSEIFIASPSSPQADHPIVPSLDKTIVCF
jgi:hypothetical protein